MLCLALSIYDNIWKYSNNAEFILKGSFTGTDGILVPDTEVIKRRALHSKG